MTTDVGLLTETARFLEQIASLGGPLSGNAMEHARRLHEASSQYVHGGLRALLEGLECENIDKLLTQSPDILRAVGVEIAKAAKLGAHLYNAQRYISHGEASK